jgi:hypothetical protein
MRGFPSLPINIYKEDDTRDPVTKVITNGNYIVWCTEKKPIQLLKLNEITNKYGMFQTLENTIGEKRVAISGNTIVTGSPGESNSIKVWTLSNGLYRYTKTLKIPNDIVVNLVIEGSHIISNTSSGRIIIHNLQELGPLISC